MVGISVIRVGHRLARDKRIATHVALVARAFGADSIYYTGDKDTSMEESIGKIVDDWGGSFKIKHVTKSFIKNFKGTKVHLTMYGLPFQDNIKKVKKEKNLLIIVGGQKVDFDIYEAADYNLSVTSQPHSEVASLAVFLDRYFAGKELTKKFGGKEIIPQELGKKFK